MSRLTVISVKDEGRQNVPEKKFEFPKLKGV